MTATLLHLSSSLALLSNEELNQIVTRAQAELMFRLNTQTNIVNAILLDGDKGTDETNTDS